MKNIHRIALALLLFLGAASMPCSVWAAQLSLSCSITNNQVWNLSGIVDGAAPQISMYKGSTYVQRFFADSSGRATVDAQFAAETTPQIYTLYNGTDSSAQFLTQTDCPAKTAAQATPESNQKATPVTSTQATSTTPTQSTDTSTDPIVDPETDTVASDSQATVSDAAMNGAAVTSKLSKSSIILFAVIAAAILLYMIIVSWRVFSKAGAPGWASLIPVYNTVILYRLGGKSGWWSLALLIPVVNLVAMVILLLAYIEIARRFGKSTLFGVFGLFVFSIVGWSILAFGRAQYGGSGLNQSAQNPLA